MSFPFSAIVTASGAITFTARDGASHTIPRENTRYDEAKEILRQITGASEDDQDDLISDLVSISSPVKAIASDTGGRVFVNEGKVFFRDLLDSAPTEVHNVVAERIIWMIGEGFDAKPMLSFLDNLMDNPSFRSVNDLYRFMERNQMGITPDGHLLAYKKVRGNFRDIHSGQFDNSPGQRPKMRRNEVEDNPNKTCSKGLHVCSFSYLPNFSSYGSGDRVVVCKVNPRDVVSVPVDYNDAKMRVCEYLVLKEIEHRITGDILASRPVIDESVDLHEEDDDVEKCPRCGADIGDANYCKACGWEKRDDKPEDASAPNADAASPVIEFRQGDQWQELIGHGCATMQEAETYVSSLDTSGKSLRIRDPKPADEAPAPAVSAPSTVWPGKLEDRPVDLREAVSGVEQTATGLFGDNAPVAVHMRLDGDGGLEVKMRPENDMWRKARRLVTEHLGVDEEKVTSTSLIMNDLGADSLDTIELVMAFEEEFGIEIRDEEMNGGDVSFQQIIDWLEKHVERPV